MVRVAPINLAFNPHTLWFDPGDIEVSKDDAVVVETARGIEYGRAAGDVMEVSDERIASLKSPLKPVVRIADATDAEQAARMEEKSREALPVFKEMVANSGIEMSPVSVEYLFDGDKAVFYFEAEERVDFRDLVRKLAARFHVRIDMRQIGVRDEARMVGGLGHCGQELCCKRMGGDFNPVSIRMAKEQDLSLNPQKISGLCGRLMCCLRYEYDAYKDFKSRAPKINAMIDTPDGPAKVTGLDVPREYVTLRREGEKPVRLPLSAFEPASGEGARPHEVDADAWREALVQAEGGFTGEVSALLASRLTGSDKLAESGSLRHTGAAGADALAGKASQGQTKRRGKKPKSGGKSPEAAEGNRKPRRRRSTTISAVTSEPDTDTREAAPHRRTQTPAETQGGSSATRGDGGKRRSRNRSHAAEGSKAGKDVSRGSSKSKQDSTHGQAQGAQRDTQRTAGPRPGQRSSGLARDHRDGAAHGGSSGSRAEQGKCRSQGGKKSKNHGQTQSRSHEGGGWEKQEGASSHRRPRRRSHASQASADAKNQHPTQEGSGSASPAGTT